MMGQRPHGRWPISTPAQSLVQFPIPCDITGTPLCSGYGTKRGYPGDLRARHRDVRDSRRMRHHKDGGKRSACRQRADQRLLLREREGPGNEPRDQPTSPANADTGR